MSVKQRVVARIGAMMRFKNYLILLPKSACINKLYLSEPIKSTARPELSVRVLTIVLLDCTQADVHPGRPGHQVGLDFQQGLVQG